MGEHGDSDRRAGQRVLVLWVCWVVLALILVAAGAVAGLPFRERAPAVADESAAPASEPAGPPAADGSRPRPPAEVPVVREAVVAAAPTARARVRFRKGLVGNRGHYAGPVDVLVDGLAVRTLQVANRDAVELELPLAARAIAFVAPGWRPAATDPSLLRAGPVELPDVVFEPDATLRLEVAGLPAEWRGTVVWYAGSDREQLAAGTLENLRPGASRAEFPCLSGHAFQWRADLRDRSLVAAQSGSEPPLQPGEVRTVVVDLHDLPTQRYVVVGPSDELRPHLVVEPLPADLPRWRPGEFSIALDAQGGFERRAREPARFFVATADSYVALAETAAGRVQELRPEQQLVGVQMLDDDCQPIASQLLTEHGTTRGAEQLVHVVARDRLGDRLLLASKATGPLSFATARFAPDLDFVRLLPSHAERLGCLTVHVRGSKSAGPAAGLQLVQVLAADGALVQGRPGGDAVEFRALPPGVYDVRWLCAGVPGPWIARQVAVAAGRPCRLDATWPALVEWTGEVLGHAEAPVAQRFLQLRFGEWPGLAGGVHTRIADDGSFRLQLLSGREPEPVVEFRWGLMHPRGEVVAVDGERRHVVVRPPPGIRWVTLRAELTEPGPWMAILHAEPQGVPWMVVQHDEQRPVAVPAGVVLGGALYDRYAPEGRLVAWFEVDGSRADVVLRPTGGRTVELRQATPTKGRSVALVGPRGQLDRGHTFVGGEALRVFVPDGTRGLAVFDGDDPAAPRRELPLGPDAVVLVP